MRGACLCVVGCASVWVGALMLVFRLIQSLPATFEDISDSSEEDTEIKRVTNRGECAGPCKAVKRPEQTMDKSFFSETTINYFVILA